LLWTQLPPLPDPEGFAGMFAGVSQGALIAAGGANFPDKKPWDGGAKRWYDTVFVLPPGGTNWTVAGKLPRPLAYGVSITTAAGTVSVSTPESAAGTLTPRFGQRP